MPPLKSSRELREMTDKELLRAMASPAAYGEAWPETWFLDEYRARQTEKQTRTMVRLTWAIGAMTVISTVFVVLSALHVVG